MDLLPSTPNHTYQPEDHFELYQHLDQYGQYHNQGPQERSVDGLQAYLGHSGPLPSSPEEHDQNYFPVDYSPADDTMYCQAIQDMCAQYDDYALSLIAPGSCTLENQPHENQPHELAYYFPASGSLDAGSCCVDSGPCLGNEVEATIPLRLSEISTYSELMPHVMADHHQYRTPSNDTPIPLALPAEESPGYISPPHKREEKPQRYHPYSRSSSARGITGSVSPVVGQSACIQQDKGQREDPDSPSHCTPHIPDDYLKSPVTVTPVDSMSASPSQAADELVPYAVGEVPKEKKKRRRETVSLACVFCRRRKIGCKQPPEGSQDMTCSQCLSRNLQCIYPDMSGRGYPDMSRIGLRMQPLLQWPSQRTR